MAGLDPALVFDVIADSAGSSRMFQIRGPMMVRGQYDEPTATMTTHSIVSPFRCFSTARAISLRQWRDQLIPPIRAKPIVSSNQLLPRRLPARPTHRPTPHQSPRSLSQTTFPCRLKEVRSVLGKDAVDIVQNRVVLNLGMSCEPCFDLISARSTSTEERSDIGELATFLPTSSRPSWNNRQDDDFAVIESDLEVIQKQLSRLPTRRELARTGSASSSRR